MDRGSLQFCHASRLTLLGAILVASRVVDGNLVQNATLVSNASGTEEAATMDPKMWHPFIVQEPSKEKATEGETVVLGCQFFNPKGASLSDLTVDWYKDDGKHHLHLMRNNDTLVANYSRAFISGDLSAGVASLTIQNVTTNDHGIYYCQVMLPGGETVMGEGVKVRIRTAHGNLGVEESIGTIIGVVVAAVGVVIGLVIILTPRFRKHLPCIKRQPQA
ncbi:V-set and immunoglobulin domain-containing protein 10-like [Ambystoma mexicanum]|uniref:V-set and immunoglobulin domain-containing protein 10-like n=1 Tax=Ambystoma mexicanum TaxID=8296 RepID=UPI0037E7737A